MHTRDHVPASLLKKAASCFVVLAATLAGTFSFAQQTANRLDQLTVDKVIGSAVSLANHDYRDVEEAIGRFKNGDVSAARQYLEMARGKFPQLPPVDVTLAKMQLFVPNGQAARLLLEKAVTEHPGDPEAYLMLADQAFAGNRTTEAYAVFKFSDGIVDAFSGNDKRKRDFEIRVVAGQAAVFERRRQWENALPLLQQWVELDPDSAAARHRLGVSLFMTNQAAKAFEQFTEARDIDPNMNHPYISLGQLLTQKEELDKARTAFERAYQEDGDNDGTAQAYAEWLIQQDKLDKAQEVATALRQKSPTSQTAMLLQGVVAKLRGNMEGVKAAMNAVLGMDPSNATAINLLALTLIESDDQADRDRALKYAEMNAQRFPDASQANITLAWIYHKLGRAREAEAQVKVGAQAGRVNADSAYMVATILYEQGRPDQAKLMLEQLLERAGGGTFLFRKDAENLLDQLQNSTNF